MRLGKWWLKHGPGSPGSIARDVARTFAAERAREPGRGAQDAVRGTLARLVDPRQPHDRMLALSEGSLAKLALLVVAVERRRDLLDIPPDVYMLVCDAVLEVLREEAPGQMEKEFREYGNERSIGHFRDFWVEISGFPR